MNISGLIYLLRTSKDFVSINNRRKEIACLLPEFASMFDYDQNNSYHPL